MDSHVDLPAVLLAEFSSTAINPLVWAVVLVAGLMSRWRRWPVRGAAAAVGLARGLAAGWAAGLDAEAVLAVTGALLGSLLVAEVMLTVIVPIIRFVWTCCSVTIDIVVGVVRHLFGPAPRSTEPEAEKPADDLGPRP